MSDYWKDVAAAPPPSGSATAAEFLVPTNARLALRVKTSAMWVWAFAGLTVVNLTLAHVGAPIRMVFSFFSAEVLVAVGKAIGPNAKLIALVVSTLLLAGTATLGWVMIRYHRWAFLAAMVLVALDAAVIYTWTTLAGLWPFLLHGLALYYLWAGFKAAQLFLERKRNGQA